MSNSILRLFLLSIVFLFSLAPIAGAQSTCEYSLLTPTGVLYAYKCQLDCYSCNDPSNPLPNPNCEACTRLENAFPILKQEECVDKIIETCDQPPSPNQ
jgi:hypothetical protein